MWLLGEIETEIKKHRIDILKECETKGVKINYYFGSDNKYLGMGISDDDCKRNYGLS